MTIRQQGGVFGRNPQFANVSASKLNVDNVQVDGNTISTTDTNGTLVLAPNGSGLVRTSSPISLLAGRDFRLSADGSGFLLRDASTSRELLRGTLAGDISLPYGNLVVTNGKGIDFSATAGTGTSELFDDYEEGTWTPTFGNLTLGDGVSTGAYTKIGDTVTIYGKLVLGSTTTVDGVLSVTNLPFSAASGFNPIGDMRLLDQGTNSFAAQVSVNTTSLTFRSAVANSTYLLWGQVNATNPFTWAPTDQIEFNAVYKAA